MPVVISAALVVPNTPEAEVRVLEAILAAVIVLLAIESAVTAFVKILGVVIASSAIFVVVIASAAILVPAIKTPVAFTEPANGLNIPAVVTCLTQ